MDIGLLGLGASLGAGLTIVGGGFGIGRLSAAAVEAIARQPEAAGDIRGSMIITAAFIEGISLFAVVVCLLVALNTGDEKVLAAVGQVVGR